MASYNFNTLANLAPLSAANSTSRPGSRAASPHAANPATFHSNQQQQSHHAPLPQHNPQHVQQGHNQYATGPQNTTTTTTHHSAYAAAPMPTIPGEACSFGQSYYGNRTATTAAPAPQQAFQAPTATAPLSYGGGATSNGSYAPAAPFSSATNYGGSNPQAPPAPAPTQSNFNHDASQKLRELAQAKVVEIEAMDSEMRQLEAEEHQLLERQKVATHQESELPALNNHIIELWQGFHQADTQERQEEDARRRDPSRFDEEYILRMQIQEAEKRVEGARRHAADVANRKQQAHDALESLSHVPALKARQEDQLEKLSKGFEHVEVQRLLLIAKCGKSVENKQYKLGYTELETSRAGHARDHIRRIDREAQEDGETPVTDAHILATSASSQQSQHQHQQYGAPEKEDGDSAGEEDDVPQTLESELEGLAGGEGMDSICMSFNTGSKRRRLESTGSTGGGQQHHSSLCV